MNYRELYRRITECEVFSVTGQDVNWYLDVDYNQGVIRLLFKGSSIDDWVYRFCSPDFFTRKVYKKQHSKYLRAYTNIAELYKSGRDVFIPATINTINRNPDFKVIIAGHSDGAGFAQLAAEDLNFHTRTQEHLIETGIRPVLVVFGSPKILVGKACAEYVRRCCSEVVEISQINDFITKCPSQRKFHHISDSYFEIGETYDFSKMFNIKKYHYNYDDPSIYEYKHHPNIDV